MIFSKKETLQGLEPSERSTIPSFEKPLDPGRDLGEVGLVVDPQDL